jgi:hypothetical protein
MLDGNFIIERINNTIRMVGSASYLEESGFHHVLGYINIVKELNELSFERVLHILKTLKSKGGIYEKFYNHLLKDGVLSDNFFELDELFNPTTKNLNYYLKKDDFEDSEFNVLQRQLNEQNDILNKRYQMIYENENKLSQESIINSGIDFKLNKLESSIRQDVLFFLKNDIKRMSNEDYGTFMLLITKYRNGER